MKKYLLLFSLFVFFNGHISAHSGRPKYHVIIDTDGAVDDFRAISMFLAGNDIRVLAITCSQGTLKPCRCCEKVSSLLHTYYHNGISVGCSDTIHSRLPVWSYFAEQIRWGKPHDSPSVKENSIHLLNRVLNDYPSKVILVALGSLKTYSDWFKNNPAMTERIERIIWYNSLESKEGFNYLLDTSAYNFIVQTNIPVHIVANNRKDLVCNDEYLRTVKKSGSMYANHIYKSHQQPPVLEKVKQNHLQLWDDLVPLYLTVPVLFTTRTKNEITYAFLEKSISPSIVSDLVFKLVNSASATNNRVFYSFPVDTLLYKSGYAKILPATIEKYGVVEWKAITMTNEIHGHTGIYSIVGAKMGIRALEYFNVGVNNLNILSYAGRKPPLSCFNDGLQISTGATIGQGLITISDSVSHIPTVIVEFNNQKVQISLKSNISEQIQADIATGVKKYGYSEKYWQYIEDLALKYWVDFDRHEIFDIQKM